MFKFILTISLILLCSVQSSANSSEDYIRKNAVQFDSNYQPMSYLLHTLPGTPIKILDIRAIQVRYTGGNIWACMGNTEADCKTHQMNPPPNPYSSAVSYNRYFLAESLSNGYNATLFERTLTASPPAFQQEHIC